MDNRKHMGKDKEGAIIPVAPNFSEMSGFSPRNIKYMRKFAECWTNYEIVQRVVAQIPWRTNISLMDKLYDEESRRERSICKGCFPVKAVYK